jgi:hypothetical protein
LYTPGASDSAAPDSPDRVHTGFKPLTAKNAKNAKQFDGQKLQMDMREYE